MNVGTSREITGSITKDSESITITNWPQSKTHGGYTHGDDVQNDIATHQRTTTTSPLAGRGLTHEPGGVGDVGADLAVDLDEPLHADLLDLVSGQGVLQPVPQEDDEGQALPQFVGTGGGTRSLGGGGGERGLTVNILDHGGSKHLSSWTETRA